MGFGANGSINLHDFLAYVRCLHCLAMNFSLDSSSGAAKYDNPFLITEMDTLTKKNDFTRCLFFGSEGSRFVS